MTLEMIALWVLAGALAGLLAGFLMKRGSPGLTVDIPLGLVGSMVGAGSSSGSRRRRGWSRSLWSRSSERPS
jgi:uncharacterized membrane protein YeaQ/YmgE (transglycosylase-associated protein family)